MSVWGIESEYRTVQMAIMSIGSEVLRMKRTHGLGEREMELGELLIADCQTNLLV